MDDIFKYNLNAAYQPNGGKDLQIISAKDLYKQKIVVSETDYFPATFPNVLTSYEMDENDKRMNIWQHEPFRLWQTQINFATWCASSACGVSSQHLNEKTHPLIKSLYRFHVYYHIRRILKELQTPLPFEHSFKQYDNPYNNEQFLKICQEYGVDTNPMKYRGQYFFSSYQRGQPGSGLSYYDENSMTRWIIEKSKGFTKPGLFMISESVRAYAYLILSSQASARSSIIGNDSSALTAQRIFINNFEDIVNRRVDIQEDIKRYQTTLNYASSKVDYSVGQGIYMLPSDMNLKIKTNIVGYNNKILISDTDLNLGVNKKINITHHVSSTQNKSSQVHRKTIKSKQTTPTIKAPSHEEEKIALILGTTTVFSIWYMFR